MMIERPPREPSSRLARLTVALLVFAVAGFVFTAFAFNGPTQAPPGGNGAIGSNSANSVAFGASSTVSSTLVYIVGSSTNAADNSLNIVDALGNALLVVRNNGTVSIATSSSAGALTVGGNIYANGNLVGGSISAANVTTGVFNSGVSTSSGNFAFPANLGVNTSTNVSLPGNLSDYGSLWQGGGLVTLASTTIAGNATTTGLTITGAPNATCLATNAAGVVSVGSCGSAGGTVSTSSAVSANNFAFWVSDGKLNGTSTLTLSGTTLAQSNNLTVGGTVSVATTTSAGLAKLLVNGQIKYVM